MASPANEQVLDIDSVGIETKDISFPKGRPSQGPRRIRRALAVFAVLMSLALHIFIVWSLFPTDLDIGSSGGTGFADQIEIRASAESSSGLEGDIGETAEETVQSPQAINVTMVYAPPPPEPEEYLPEEEELIEEEVEEPEPEPVVEEEIIEEEVEEIEVAEIAPEVEEALIEVDAETATDVQTAEGGQAGLQDTLAGSQTGTASEGSGSGNADLARPGNYVPGGELRELLSGWTLIGTNGFSDGSTNYQNDSMRQDIPWRVYYAPNGRIRARWQRYGTARAHGDWGYHWYEESGRWTIEGDQLCQNIRRWGSDSTTCFEVHRDGSRVAMYYASCRGVFRCWPGRKGPEGIVRSGRHLRD